MQSFFKCLQTEIQKKPGPRSNTADVARNRPAMSAIWNRIQTQSSTFASPSASAIAEKTSKTRVRVNVVASMANRNAIQTCTLHLVWETIVTTFPVLFLTLSAGFSKGARVERFFLQGHFFIFTP